MDKSKLRKIFNEVDPIGLTVYGCSEDEYDPEIDDVLSYFADMQKKPTKEELSGIIYSIFAKWFGNNIAQNGVTFGTFNKIAKMILEID